MFRNRVAAVMAGALLGVLPMLALADREAAQELIIQGRFDEALREINTLLAASPDDAELRFLKGIAYAEQGEDDLAIEVFAGLTQDYPELPEPYNNLAVLFAQRGDYDKARESLLAAIQTHPSYSTAHENLGDLYAKMAGNSYNRALQENQSNDSARVKLAKMNTLFAPPSQAVAATPPPATSVAAATPTPQQETVSQQPPATEPAVAQQAAVTPDPVSEPPASVQSEPSGANMQAAANEIAGTIGSWSSAWSSQDVEAYLSFYASDFRPTRGLSRSAWVAQRRERVARPQFIRVTVTDLFVDVSSANTARAVFKQDYASPGYEDSVIKTLNLTREGGAWKIQREVSRAP
ncbi:MAG: tetratricopeptide repeat protein [Gammaproteobacteria bacterium]|nr:tetratricopeptide repeat protein [Gammaproteobacteria bacterium]